MIVNRKTVFSPFFFFFFVLTVYCEDWEFIVTQDSFFYDITLRNPEYLHENTRIISDNTATYGINVEGNRNPSLGFIHHSLRGPSVRAKNVIPSNTKDLFGKDILADENNFLVSYSIDILRSGNRETLLDHESYYKDNQSYFEPAYERDVYWHEEYDSDAAGFFAFNAVLFFGVLYADCQALIVNNIEKTEYGYKVHCRVSSSHNRIAVTILTSGWTLAKEKEVFYLLIYIDGDYIDLYIDNRNNFLGTFVSVSDEFVKQYNNLIKTNTCDLSKIQWPRRSDGSMDYLDKLNQSAINNNEEIDGKEHTENFTNIENESKIVKNNIRLGTLPLWVWYSIIGGFVITIGIMMYFILKKKK